MISDGTHDETARQTGVDVPLGSLSGNSVVDGACRRRVPALAVLERAPPAAGNPAFAPRPGMGAEGVVNT